MKRLVSSLSSLRVTLTLWYVAILAVVLAASSGVIYVTEQRYLEAQVDGRLVTGLQQIAVARQLRDGHVPGRRLSKGPFSWRSCTAGGDPFAVVGLLTTPQGRVLDECAPGLLDAHAIQSLAEAQAALLVLGQGGGINQRAVSSPFSSAPVLIRFTGKRLMVRGQPTELVVGITSDTPEQLAALQRMLLVGVPLILIPCAGTGYWLVNRALRPVQKIAALARAIGERDLSERLDLRRRDELGALADTFDEMLERLEAAFARQRQFTADASHELRTPLTIVDLHATHALAEPRASEEYRGAIGIMRQENAYMTRLVNDLLLLARADGGPAMLECEEVYLEEVILDAVDRLAPLAEQYRVGVVVVSLETLPVRGDQLHLTRMVTNVVENALKYTAGVGTRVQVEARHRQRNGVAGVLLKVTDDGPEIPLEHLSLVCDRFYRVNAARTHRADDGPVPTRHLEPAGSGLGLSIAQWIAESHGGNLQIDSGVGRGVVVEIWLPTS